MATYRLKRLTKDNEQVQSYNNNNLDESELIEQEKLFTDQQNAKNNGGNINCIISHLFIMDMKIDYQSQWKHHHDELESWYSHVIKQRIKDKGDAEAIVEHYFRQLTKKSITEIVKKLAEEYQHPRCIQEQPKNLVTEESIKKYKDTLIWIFSFSTPEEARKAMEKKYPYNL